MEKKARACEDAPESDPSENRMVKRYDNHIYFYDSLDSGTFFLLQLCCKQIIAERQSSIILEIQSPGGDATIDAYSYLQALGKQIPIIVYVSGLCASASTLMLLSVPLANRIASPMASFLFHSPAIGIGESFINNTGMTSSKENLDLYTSFYKKIYKEETGIPQKDLDDILNFKEKTYTADQAKKLKIISQIGVLP